ncbi:MAG TPA: hypothetical protein VK395_03540 [Gemmataceae bacterium]|nr:hypothetical protein [Gemmataceae bacterium]
MFKGFHAFKVAASVKELGQCRGRQGRVRQISVIEFGFVIEHCLGKVGVSEIGSRKIGTAKIAMLNQRAHERNIGEIAVGEVAAGESAANESGILEISAPELTLRPYRPACVHMFEYRFDGPNLQTASVPEIALRKGGPVYLETIKTTATEVALLQHFPIQ